MFQWNADTTTRWMLAQLPEGLRVAVYDAYDQQWSGAELLALDLKQSWVQQVIHTVFVSMTYVHDIYSLLSCKILRVVPGCSRRGRVSASRSIESTAHQDLAYFVPFQAENPKSIRNSAHGNREMPRNTL